MPRGNGAAVEDLHRELAGWVEEAQREAALLNAAHGEHLIRGGGRALPLKGPGVQTLSNLREHAYRNRSL